MAIPGSNGAKDPNPPSARTTVKSLARVDASRFGRRDCLVPVTRRYEPEPRALEELVEVLYRLLVDVPVNKPATASAPSELTCFSLPPE
jgi:hypothetical protein